MNRTIKYRGITKQTNTYVYGNLNIEYEGTAHICWWESRLIEEDTNTWEPVHCMEEVHKESVKQYIGIDKHGKEVWESDKNSRGESIEWNSLHNGWFWFHQGGAQREVLSSVYNDRGENVPFYITMK